MASPPLSDEVLQESVDALRVHDFRKDLAARSLNINYETFKSRIKLAARRGLMGTKPVLPGFQISKTTAVTNAVGILVREFVQQKPEPGEKFQLPEGFALKRVSAYTDAHGNIIGQWQIAAEDKANTLAAIAAAVDELKQDLPRVAPTKGPDHTNGMLLNQYTVTDLHFGMLAWAEETGGADYDLKIAEKLLLDWFAAAIGMAPDAEVAVLAQLGDLMHHDSFESVTPEHRNVLDADSRLQKIIRVVIRVLRQILAMLLERHQRVHVIMAAGNHDPASSAWLRELLSALYENEPRITIDSSPDIYYAYEWGSVGLFYHHGHKRTVKDVDSMFASRFREIYGRASKSYGHIGHHHTDEVKDGNLMRIERHRTLAPPDAYGASKWIADQDAKVICYHKMHGEVSRITLSPQMVRGAQHEISATPAPKAHHDEAPSTSPLAV